MFTLKDEAQAEYGAVAYPTTHSPAPSSHWHALHSSFVAMVAGALSLLFCSIAFAIDAERLLFLLALWCAVVWLPHALVLLLQHAYALRLHWNLLNHGPAYQTLLPARNEPLPTSPPVDRHSFHAGAIRNSPLPVYAPAAAVAASKLYRSNAIDIPAPVLKEFISLLPTRGLSRNRWLNYQWASGGDACDRALYEALVSLVESAGGVTNRGHGKSGLVCKTPQELYALLEVPT